MKSEDESDIAESAPEADSVVPIQPQRRSMTCLVAMILMLLIALVGGLYLAFSLFGTQSEIPAP